MTDFGEWLAHLEAHLDFGGQIGEGAARDLFKHCLELRASLKPFAEAADIIDDPKNHPELNNNPDRASHGMGHVKQKHLRAARAVLRGPA